MWIEQCGWRAYYVCVDVRFSELKTARIVLLSTAGKSLITNQNVIPRTI